MTAAPALRAALARARAVRRARLRLQLLRRAPFPARRKLDVVAGALRGRRRRAHQAAAGRRRWASSCRCYHPLRLAEEIAIVDQMLGGRFECGLVPGISPAISRRSASTTTSASRRPSSSCTTCAPPMATQQPFALPRRQPQDRQRAARGAAGAEAASAALDDEPRSADAGVLRQGRHQHRLFHQLPAPRGRARATGNSSPTGTAPGIGRKPNIAYSTVVYVDETDKKALDTGAVSREPRL